MFTGKIGAINALADYGMQVKSTPDYDSFEKRLEKAFDSRNDEELKKVCQSFEQLFLSMMYRQMKTSISRSDLFGNSAGKDIFESMLDDALIEEASKNSRLGIADMMYKQISESMNRLYKPSSVRKEV